MLTRTAALVDYTELLFSLFNRELPATLERARVDQEYGNVKNTFEFLGKKYEDFPIRKFVFKLLGCDLCLACYTGAVLSLCFMSPLGFTIAFFGLVGNLLLSKLI